MSVQTALFASFLYFVMINGAPVPEPQPSRDPNYLVLEEYHPLAAAFNQRDRARAQAIKSRPVQKPHPVEILVDMPESSDEPEPQSASGARQLGRTSHFQLPTDKGPLLYHPVKLNTESRWLDWTKWSACVNGERIRIRHCLEVKGVKCDGPSVETRKCYSFQHSSIPFAKDPFSIEKEIQG